jgi:4-aminobutyrate aminotransferase
VTTLTQPQNEAGRHEWIGPAPWIVTAPPGPQAMQATARDARVCSPSLTRPYPLVVRRAQGSIVEDVDGNRYLDFTAGIAVCSTGHCHPQVVAAIDRQSRHLIHMCGSDFYYEPMIALAEKLAAIAPGEDEKRVLFTNSGAESVEAAIKLARHYTQRKVIVAFYGAFHGRTMGALSLTASKFRQKERFGPLVPMVEHVAYGDLKAIERDIFKRVAAPEEVAAIFVEPIQGEGGYIVPSAEFLPGLREMCDKHGIMLVMDEIQSGMGRTGKMFACEHWNVEPDILVLAKGLASGMPLGAVVARAHIMNWPQGAQGSTFGGNPVSCAASLATIDLLEKQYMANAEKLQPHAMEKLRRIEQKHRCIAHPRGLGLMLAVDIVKDRRSRDPDPPLRDRIVNEAFSRGLLLLGCGETGIRFTPPLCINRVQLEIGLDVFDEAVSTVES